MSEQYPERWDPDTDSDGYGTDEGSSPGVPYGDGQGGHPGQPAADPDSGSSGDDGTTGTGDDAR